jgi:aminomethyltransferase
LRLKDDEYWLTAAEPNLRYFQDLVGRHQVEITDISPDYGILAVQGPHAGHVLQQLSKAVTKLKYFGVTETKIAQKPVVISRTGYTGDLGYEIWVRSEDALSVWDAIMAAGVGYNITPIGGVALSMARIEAGLLLIDVDFESARYAWIDGQCSTPLELGFQWMFRNLAQDDRSFIGRRAIERELAEGTSRWRLVGLEIDWLSYQQIYNELGLIAPKDATPIEGGMSLYTDNWTCIGYAPSFMYSPILQKHIAFGKVPLTMAKPGQEVRLELMVNHVPKYVLARVVSLPFFNPARKTA